MKWRISTILKWALALNFIALLLTWPLSLLLMPYIYVGSLEYIMAALYLGLPFTLAALLCAVTLETGRVRKLMWSGMIAAAVSVPLWLIVIWFANSGMFLSSPIENFVAFVICVTLWAAYCAVLGLLMHYRISPLVSWTLRMPTIVITSAVFAAGVVTAVTKGDLFDDEFAMGRFFSTSIIIILIGTMLTLVLGRLRALTGDDTEDDSPRIDFTLWCPRCNLKQPFVTGPGNCRGCGLAVKVTPP